jgi:hypothetical protein
MKKIISLYVLSLLVFSCKCFGVLPTGNRPEGTNPFLSEPVSSHVFLDRYLYYLSQQEYALAPRYNHGRDFNVIDFDETGSSLFLPTTSPTITTPNTNNQPHESTPPALDPETTTDLVDYAEDLACPICFASAQRLTDKNIALVTTTCCKQAMCLSCIQTIIARRNNCPYCRHNQLEYTEKNTTIIAEPSEQTEESAALSREQVDSAESSFHAESLESLTFVRHVGRAGSGGHWELG